MVTLRKMRAEEFARYREYFVEDYGREISDNYGHTMKKALEIANTTIENDLPDGALTRNQELMCIESADQADPQLLGYLWYVVQEKETTAFILDFYLYEASRGRGLAMASITELEKKLAADNICQIKLRVAHDNNHALNLYKKSGFSITGYNMIKKIPDASHD